MLIWVIKMHYYYYTTIFPWAHKCKWVLLVLAELCFKCELSKLV